MSKKRMKRRMKRRRTVTILSLIVILVTAMLNLVWAKEKDTVTVVVKSGDTVWSIAGENNPGNKDLRKLVHEIITENDLADGMIYAGQELVIPVE